MTDLLLDPYDVEPPFAQRRLTVLSSARCGDRTDWRWVRIEPALEVGPHLSLRSTLQLDVAAIAPRHADASIEAGPWPVHVYVCRAKADETRLAADFSPDDVAIECWGLVTPADMPGPANRE